MKIIKPLLRRNRHEHRFHIRKLYDFCVYTGFLLLFVCITPLILNAEDAETDTSPATTNGVASATENKTQETESVENTDEASSDNDGSAIEPTKETITGTSKRMERYEKDGITILIDEAKTVRHDEQGIEIGFLNADKITLMSDLETGTTTEVIAVGNVEIRDQDIFATCDHAIMNNLTNTVVLKENVVVLQNKDRLETKLFTFNRTTGKQTGEGGVKFKVTVTQAAPIEAEAEEGAESSANAGEDETSTTAPGEVEGEAQEDADAEIPDADDSADLEPNTDAGDSEDADPGEDTDTDTDNPDGTETDAESEESEND